MKELNFRPLKASEIDCRVGQIYQSGCTLLLYKNSRVDMQLLDEVVGALNWKREHRRENANCVVSIYDESKAEWVSKEDVGVESYTEKEKGLASDSFKRACVNWGIGRELYTAPFIWINLYATEIDNSNGKLRLKSGVKFHVASIEYDEERSIKSVVIVDSRGAQRYPQAAQARAQVQTQTNTAEIESKKKAAQEYLTKNSLAWEYFQRGKYNHVAEIAELTTAELVEIFDLLKKGGKL